VLVIVPGRECLGLELKPMERNLTVMLDVLAQLDVKLVAVAGVMVLGLAFVFLVVLNIAHARLHVAQDPTVAAVLDVLPGANCGGCGLAGCSAYAEAVVADHGLMGKCGPGGEELVHVIAAILGIEGATSAPLRPVVRCSAHTDDMINSANYHGVQNCAEADIVAGAIGCGYGCLGMGECEQVCQFDAIRIIDGLATVDYDKCVGCGACVKACPRQLIEMLSFQEDPLLVIGCASLDKAKEVRSYCEVGCIGCGICVKQAPEIFSMQNNLAIIDYDKYADREARDKGRQKCPRKLMVYVGESNLAVKESINE